MKDQHWLGSLNLSATKALDLYCKSQEFVKSRKQLKIEQ